MALGWLQDAALPPALIHGEEISWGVPSPWGAGTEPGEHTSQSEGNACCRGEEHIPAVDQRCCSKAFEGLGRGGCGWGVES